VHPKGRVFLFTWNSKKFALAFSFVAVGVLHTFIGFCFGSETAMGIFLKINYAIHLQVTHTKTYRMFPLSHSERLLHSCYNYFSAP